MLPLLELRTTPPGRRLVTDTEVEFLAHELETMVGKQGRQSEPSNSTKKQKQEKSVDFYSVAALGCPRGGLITGVDETDRELGLTSEALQVNKGVVLRVVGANQPAEGARRPQDKDDWVRMVAAKFAVSNLEARAIVDSGEDSPENAATLGTDGLGSSNDPRKATPLPGLKFVVVSTGAWYVNPTIVEFCTKATEVTSKELGDALGDWQKQDASAPGVWSLQSKKWKRAEENRLDDDQLSDPDVDVCAILKIEGESEVHSLRIQGRDERLRVRFPVKGEMLERDQIASLIHEAIEEDWTPVDGFFAANHSLESSGPLKSALQKFVRIRTKNVALPEDREVSSRLFVASSFALCATEAGDAYLAELHISVPGHVAALKRAAIVMVEDGLPAGGAAVVQAVALLALVAGRGHVCPLRGLVAVARALASCCDSTDVFAFRRVPPNATVDSDQTAARVASDCITELRSFEGDLAMMRQFASYATLPVNRSAVRHESVPWSHLADHHVYPGMAHMCWEMQVDKEGSGFKGRLGRAIFDGVTGFNPRVQGNLLSDLLDVKEVRTAQDLMMATVLTLPRTSTGAPTRTQEMKVDLPSGVLSGAVGPVKVKVETTPQEDMQDDAGITKGTKWELQVVIGIANADEKVILEPLQRGSLEDPRMPPTASAIRKAIDEVRGKKLAIRSDLLPQTVAEYSAGGWNVGGEAWKFGDSEETNTTSVVANILPDPASTDLTDDEAVRSALLLEKVPGGVCESAEAIVKEYCSTLGQQQSLRMLSIMRGAVGTFRMPIPAKDGGIATGQAGAFDGDWKVYRALVLISRLVPGAFSPKRPPVFEIRNQGLLLKVCQWITEAARTEEAVENARWSPDGIFEGEGELKVNVTDYGFQRELVRQMLAKDNSAAITCPSHFLVLPTGSGKTVVASWYALKYASTHNVKRIIWMTVKATADTHVRDLSLFFEGRLTVSKWPDTAGDVVVIPHEELSARGRDVLIGWCLETAKTAFLVVDEVHRLFGSTIKSSGALRIADACQKSLLSTAIPPVFSPAHPLSAEWLRRSITFPTRSETVAIAALSSAAVVEPYTKQTIYVPVAIDQAQRNQMLALIRSDSSWTRLAEQARGFAEASFVERVLQEAAADRLANPGGGVFVVADNGAEADRLVAIFSRSTTAARRPSGDSGDGGLPSYQYDRDPSVAILVEVKTRSEGYSLDRLGVTVTSVLASSPATRIQFRGRIARVALQKREIIKYITIYPEGTILEFLLKRQSSLDQKMGSLGGLATLVVDFAKFTKRAEGE
jgi:hypothetical protein